MNRTELRLDALPTDVFPRMTRMLTGYDLVSLSHVSPRLLKELLPRDGVLWRERLPPQTRPPSASASWKEVYCSSHSRRFPGSEIMDDADPRRMIRGGALEVEDMIMDTWSMEPFSIDLWFAVSSDDSTSYRGGILLGAYRGGILLGAQCEDRFDERWSDEHRAFIYVDADGNLACSMTNNHEFLRSKVQFDRWHHLTLTIEHKSNEDVVQCVYLDGEMIHESEDSELDQAWDDLYYLQLGTGCLAEESRGKPASDFEGWYGLNGIIDECRFWSSALTLEQVRRLAVDHTDLADETRLAP